MLIHGFPITAKLPEDLGFGERFWYWRGFSGRTYIHSIYAVGHCPPLPGAVYVAVRRVAGERHAVTAGRFPSHWDGSVSGFSSSIARLEADEIHVHLLARDNDAADAVFEDLNRALKDVETYGGFNEEAQPMFCAA